MQKEEQRYYLSAGGVVGEIVFGKGENVEWKRRLIGEVEAIWGEGGYLKKIKRGPVDYRVEFMDEIYRRGETTGILKVRKRSQDYYFLQMSWSKTEMRVRANYIVGTAGLNIIIREAYIRLAARKKYFLLHAATCLDSRGEVFILMAKSGGGKSTTREAMMKQGWQMMGDDLLLVRREKGGWSYVSLPLVEKSYLPKKREAKRAKLFFVEKTNDAWIKRIKDPIQLLKKGLQQMFVDYERGANKVSEMVIEWISEQEEVFRLGVLLGKTDFKKLLKEEKDES